MDRPGVLILPPMLHAIALAVLLLMRLLVPLVIGPWMISAAIGAVLLVFAVVVIRGGFSAMNHAGTNVSPYEPTTAIVSSGPFRFTRNPLYVGLMSFFLSLAFFLDTWWGLIIFVPLMAILHFGVVLREEAYLERKFGATYLSYKSKVRRYV